MSVFSKKPLQSSADCTAQILVYKKFFYVKVFPAYLPDELMIKVISIQVRAKHPHTLKRKRNDKKLAH